MYNALASMDGRSREARRLRAILADMRRRYPTATAEEIRQCATLVVACEIIKMRVVMGESSRSLAALSVLEMRAGAATRRLDALHGIPVSQVARVPDWAARKRRPKKRRLVPRVSSAGHGAATTG